MSEVDIANGEPDGSTRFGGEKIQVGHMLHHTTSVVLKGRRNTFRETLGR